ncbi:MAG: hypothetical protein KAR85_00045 [Methanosarcinales archaeon]|nr:hypothetical protein [Methanosarcinales archaeon]
MDTLNYSITALYNIGREAAVNSVEGAVRQTALKLRNIGTSAVLNNLLEEGNLIISRLEEMGINIAITALANVGVKSSMRKLGDAIDQTVWALKVWLSWNIEGCLPYRPDRMGIK